MSNEGFTSITFIAIFLILLVILLETFTIYEVYRSTKNDIDQILYIVLNSSLNKELRESASVIEEDVAIALFDEKLQMLSSKKKYKDKVDITFTEKEASSYPAYFTCKGYIQIAPIFVRGLKVKDLNIKLPFESSAFMQIK